MPGSTGFVTPYETNQIKKHNQAQAGKAAAEAAAKPPSTDQQTKEDQQKARERREQLTNELNSYAPGQAPTVQRTTLQPAQTADAAQLANGTPVQAATVGQAPVVIQQPMRTSGVLAPVGVAETERVQAATVQRTAPVAAATIAPVAAAVAPTAAPAPTATAATLDTSGQGQFRGQQARLTAALEQGAYGTGGPSAAELLLQKNVEQGAKRQLGLAAKRAQGGNVGLALKEAADATSALQAQAGQDAAILRAQEQQQAQERLIRALETGRGQDISVAGKQADLTQGANLLNTEIASRTGLANLDVASRTALANLDVASKTALTQAQLEQEARQSDAARAATANLKQADLTQGANLTNAEIAAKRAALTAQLESDAKKTQYETQSRESMTEAELAAKARAQDADAQLQTMLAQAKLNQEAGITNAQLDQQIAIKRAELQTATDQFNAEQANRTNLAQGQITSGENATDLEAILKQKALDEERAQALRDDLREQEDLVLSGDMTRLNLENQKKIESDKATKQLWGGILGTVGTVGAAFASDRRSKKDITRILEKGTDDDDLLEMLDALEGYKYRYKQPDRPGAARGERFGVMAQDLERTPVGRSLVEEAPDGEKQINVSQAVGVVLATLASMRKEMQEMKAKGARR